MIAAGWDTDQFLSDPAEATRLMLVILSQGGLQPGGLNFDAKLRRESLNVEDIFFAHISGMDAMARGLRQAAAIVNDGLLADFVAGRYKSFEGGLPGKTFQELEAHALALASDPGDDLESAQQEKAEIIFQFYT